MVAVEPGTIRRLYRTYSESLRAVRDEQRRFLADAGAGFTAQLDDIEAELTYLLLRARRPDRVVELGTLHGWSSTWILRALRDNDHGRLCSYDVRPSAREHVPAELTERWRFVPGDARATLDELPSDAEYLFVDADHSARFARWYTRALLAPAAAGDHAVTVSVHDVFHQRWAKPFGEGRVVLRWLAEHGVDWYTASRARAGAEFAALRALRAELGLGEDLRPSTVNPMIFFELGAAG